MVSPAGARVDESGPRQIFNHDVMGCTAPGVPGNHLYSGRALGMSEPGDVIQLHPDLKSEWSAIRTHYDRVGLTYTEDVVWSVKRERMAQYPEHTPSVFFFGSDEQLARPDESWHRVVDYINSKNNFMDLAEQLGVPVPHTCCYADVGDIDSADISDFRFPCYLKAAVSVSGVGIYRCEDAATLEHALGKFDSGLPVQVQAEVSAQIFLNLQYIVAPDGLRRYAATEQILDGFAHQGNCFPASHAPWSMVESMAEWLYREGMKGVFAFDVAVVEDHNATEYLAIECNPRFNGASYPTTIAFKLGVDEWQARALSTRHRNLDDLDLSGIEYDRHRGDGVVLVNWGPVAVGKPAFLIAGSQSTQDLLLTELARRLA